MKTPTALVLFFCAGSATPEVTERPLLKFHGNVAFDEVVYRSTLDLPENARATPAEALAVSAKLLGFLRRAGYDLATVRAKVEGEQISVEIDEGRLDKIIVLGEGLMETFRFKLELALPAGVFNRPILERQLRVLAERYRLRRYSYELVPVAVQESSGPQVEELESLPGLPGIHPGWPYELHILIATSPWSRGFSPEISTGSPEGLGVGGQYREQDFLVPDDRWELRARVAGALREHLDSNSSRAVLTRVFAQGRWFSPPVLSESLRPARGPLVAPALRPAPRQLPSGHLRRIRRRERVPAACDGRPGSGNRAAVPPFARQGDRGQSSDRRDTARSDPPLRRSDRGDRLQPGELRTDRKNLLDFEARGYSGSTSSDKALWMRGSYQRRFPFGWHELWWEARGRCSWVGCCFRTRNRSFAASDFARKLASTGFEFRYSFWRDVIKLGVFYDQLVFGAIDRTANTQSLASAGAGGPALHLLLADQFQVDVYFALGWKTDGSADFASSLVLRQVF